MILVVSSPADEHARVVLNELSSLGASARLLDLEWFPRTIRLAVHYDRANRREVRLRTGSEGTLDLSEVHVVWWRRGGAGRGGRAGRPQAFVLDPAIVRPSHRTFA